MSMLARLAIETKTVPRRARGRLRVVGVLFAIGFISLGIRLVDMAGGGLQGHVRAEAAVTGPEPAIRAEIRDRRGQVLAGNVEIPSVFADPRVIADPETTASLLAAALRDVDASELLKIFEHKRRFAWVKRQITPGEQQALLELGIPGVSFRYGEHRIYPTRHLASHVLGFVDLDNKGIAGVEFALQDRLENTIDGATGKPLGPLDLSLDARVQHAVRDELHQAVSEFQAQGGCGLVRDIKTGELVALVSLPDFDPNKPQLATANSRKNRCAAEVYELGSLFKVITAGMALDSGAVTLWDRFDATEPLKIGKYRVRDYHAKKRALTVPEIIAHSSNIGVAKMAFAAGGRERQQAFLKALGLTERPVVELGERGAPLMPQRWPDITTATVAYGHGIAVSPLQFLEAASTLVGDGTRVPTTLLKRDADWQFEGTPVVSPSTVRDVRWLMWLTAAKGTGAKGNSQTYLVGGKTGTADKTRIGRRGYSDRAVLASYLGVFPIDEPRYAVMIILDEPKGNERTFGYRTGGWTAAPTVGRIIDRIGPVLGVAPSTPMAATRLEDLLEIRPAWDGYHGKTEEGFAAVRPAG
ncbi:MAG: penicillin-binding protein 2 [Pseudomonadota bacterium]